MVNKVVIYHPSKYLGGSEVLFARVALLLKDELFCQVSIVGYFDGCAVRRALGERASEFEFLDCLAHEFYAELDGCVLISSARNIIRFYSEFPRAYRKISFRPVFWVVHPAELYAQVGVGYDKIKKIFGYQFLRFFYRTNPFRFSFDGLVNSLHESGSLYFMDKAVLDESEWVMGRRFEGANFLHLASGLSSSRCMNYERQGDGFVVISRLDSFKMPGMYRLLQDLESIFLEKKWSGSLSVIGDGDGFGALKEYSERLSFDVEFLGYMPGAELRDFLADREFGVLFGMGMSILEGASIGIPCIILPASDKEIINKKCYIALSDKEDSLGRYFDSPAGVPEYMCLRGLLISVLERRKEFSDSSLDFFERFYSRSAAIKNLGSILDLSLVKSLSVGYLLCGFHRVSLLARRLLGQI